MQAVTPGAYRLLHEGAAALADVEEAGMRVDLDYLEGAITSTNQQIKTLEQRLKTSPTWDRWHRRFREPNMDSREQLAAILFEEEGHTCHTKTKTGKPQADEKALDKIGNKFCRMYLNRAKLTKISGTYLQGLHREHQDGYIHPFFNLHNVKTYRGSCDSPNLMNIPIRDPAYAEIIRKAFIPREGHRIVETDYGAAEVRVAACYHRDPTMLEYIRTDHDLHRDMAAECYLVPKDQVSKEVRQQAKGSFVFAEFYGDYYPNVAAGLWEVAQTYNLQGPDGSPMLDWLAAQGITGLGACKPRTRPQAGTYEAHIQAVEKRFWGTTFPVYSRWKKKWFDKYQKLGGFQTLTGFWIKGILGRNDVINYPVQGSAFHCLLWSLTQLVKEIRRRKWRTRVVCQIHDSIVADVHEDEYEDYVALVREVMTTRVLKHYEDWLITPMVVDVEAAPVGGSWYEKTDAEI